MAIHQIPSQSVLKRLGQCCLHKGCRYCPSPPTQAQAPLPSSILGGQPILLWHRHLRWLRQRPTSGLHRRLRHVSHQPPKWIPLPLRHQPAHPQVVHPVLVSPTISPVVWRLLSMLRIFTSSKIVQCVPSWFCATTLCTMMEHLPSIY